MVNQKAEFGRVELLMHPEDVGTLRWETALKRVSQFGANVWIHVPWVAQDFDPQKKYQRALDELCAAGAQIRIVMNPDPGCSMVFGGMPQDFVWNPEIQSRNRSGNAPWILHGPKAYPVPSLFHPEYARRLELHWARMEAQLRHWLRKVVQPQVRWVSTRGFAPYMGTDHSEVTESYLHERLQRWIQDRELQDPLPQSAGKWIANSRRDRNQHWALEERVMHFWDLADHFLNRQRRTMFEHEVVDLIYPQLMPEVQLLRWQMLMLGTPVDLGELIRSVESASQTLRVHGGRRIPMREVILRDGLTTVEQFKVLTTHAVLRNDALSIRDRLDRSLIVDSHWLDDALACEWLEQECGRFARSTIHRAPNEVTTMGTNTVVRWVESCAPGGDHSLLTESVYGVFGTQVRTLSDLPSALLSLGTKILVIEDDRMVRVEDLKRLLNWCRTGGMVLQSDRAAFTEAARRYLEHVRSGEGPVSVETTMMVQFGSLHYALGLQVDSMGQGRWLTVESPDLALELTHIDAARQAWARLGEAVKSIAQMASDPTVADSRIKVTSLGSLKNLEGAGPSGRHLQIRLSNRSAQHVEFDVVTECGEGGLQARLKPFDIKDIEIEVTEPHRGQSLEDNHRRVIDDPS